MMEFGSRLLLEEWEGKTLDWSKIKTIFIISFLILDIYLMYEFFKIQVSNQYEIQTETSIEKWLKADEIEYVPLPTGYLEE